MPVSLAALGGEVAVPGDVAAEQDPVGVARFEQREQQPQPGVVALVGRFADGVERDVRAARRECAVDRRVVQQVLVADGDPVRCEAGCR